jgi:LmbE family N-acetylglucosaminyl deacetylase
MIVEAEAGSSPAGGPAGRLVARAQPPVRRAWRSIVVRRGTDVTEACTGRSALVLAPHPDDETIGCGATIARKRAAGTDVHVAVVCDGRSSHPWSEAITPGELVALRAGEVAEACRRLGVDRDALVLMGHPDGTIAGDLAGLAGEIVGLLADVRPDEVYLPSAGDWHLDHIAINRAARLALERQPVAHVAEYPVWYWADGPWDWTAPAPRLRKLGHLLADPIASAWRLRPVLVSTAGFVAAKREALHAFRSQRENLTGEPTWATLPDGWFEPFLGDWEPFFPV